MAFSLALRSLLEHQESKRRPSFVFFVSWGRVGSLGVPLLGRVVEDMCFHIERGLSVLDRSDGYYK